MTDFGVAEELNDFGESDVLSKSSGSPAFQPPEVASGSSMFSPAKVDVWAIGIVLYIMVIGKYPFSGNNVYTLYESISKGEYILPDTLPPSLIDLIQAILQIDPRKRLSIQQIKAHTWVTSNIESSDLYVPVGMLLLPEEHINSIFSNIESEDEHDCDFFTKNEDEEENIYKKSEILQRELSNSSNNTENINKNNIINNKLKPLSHTSWQVRCSIM